MRLISEDAVTSRLDDLDGVSVILIMIFVSCPVLTTIPITHSVFLSTHPRNKILLVCIASRPLGPRSMTPENESINLFGCSISILPWIEARDVGLVTYNIGVSNGVKKQNYVIIGEEITSHNYQVHGIRKSIS